MLYAPLLLMGSGSFVRGSGAGALYGDLDKVLCGDSGARCSTVTSVEQVSAVMVEQVSTVTVELELYGDSGVSALR
jgi:hypothetical protein